MGMTQYRVEFRLTMPSCPSWNGKWSGEGKNYTVVRELPYEALTRLFGHELNDFDLSKCQRIWSHGWSDGWRAMITARLVPVVEELPPSDGFHGYEWMVDNILQNGSPYAEVTS